MKKKPYRGAGLALLALTPCFYRKRSFLAVLCRRDAAARDAGILMAG
jgi:hypothetical protein